MRRQEFVTVQKTDPLMTLSTLVPASIRRSIMQTQVNANPAQQTILLTTQQIAVSVQKALFSTARLTFAKSMLIARPNTQQFKILVSNVPEGMFSDLSQKLEESVSYILKFDL